MVVLAVAEKLLLLLSRNRNYRFLSLSYFLAVLMINAILLGSKIEVSLLLVIKINSNPRYELTEA